MRLADPPTQHSSSLFGGWAACNGHKSIIQSDFLPLVYLLSCRPKRRRVFPSLLFASWLITAGSLIGGRTFSYSLCMVAISHCSILLPITPPVLLLLLLLLLLSPPPPPPLRFLFADRIWAMIWCGSIGGASDRRESGIGGGGAPLLGDCWYGWQPW